MKRFLASSILGVSFFTFANPLKADWDKYVINLSDTQIIREMIYNIPNDVSSGVRQIGYRSYMIKIYNYNSNTGETSLINSFLQGDESNIGSEEWRFEKVSANGYDSDEGKMKFISNNGQKEFTYDLNSNNWTISDYVAPTTVTNDFDVSYSIPDLIKSTNGNISVEYNGSKLLEQKGDGSVQIGSDSNDIDITAEGLNIDGNPLITKKDNGEIHIGKNSLITKSEEETLSDGRKVQPLYAKDAKETKYQLTLMEVNY
jgi:hypothetical protein